MARCKDTWLAHQRKRWMRPDAYRWFAPKHANFLPPHERKAGFNPDQPRDELGQWTETGAEEEADQSAESVSLDEFGSARRGQGIILSLGASIAIFLYRLRPRLSSTKRRLGGFQQKVEITNLDMIRPGLIKTLQRLLEVHPRWDIVVGMAVRDSRGVSRNMGLTIRAHEIIDGLQRQYLPEPYRSFQYEGSRPGTEND